MRQQAHTALSKRVFAHIRNKTTDRRPQVTHHAVSHYTCPQRFQQERRKLFRELPILVTLSCQLPSPGSFITDDNTGVPLLIVRGDDGKARAFINACQHRGARLADGQGRVKRRFTRPYHAWSFTTDGQLAQLPHSADFTGFDQQNCRLQERPVAEAYGMIWVRPEGDAAIHMADMLCGLEDDLAHFNFTDYHNYETRRIDVALNWKLVIDTFLEPYHFATCIAPQWLRSSFPICAYSMPLAATCAKLSRAEQSPSSWINPRPNGTSSTTAPWFMCCIRIRFS